LIRLLAVIVAVSIAGCAKQSPEPDLFPKWSFRPPPGWSVGAPLRGPFGLPGAQGVRVWKPRAGTDLITLQIVRSDGSVSPGSSEEVVRAITLCKGRRAELLHRSFPFGIDTDGVRMRENGMLASASYAYAKAPGPDPQAEASIRSLCPR
jgi:hypothetical protein